MLSSIKAVFMWFELGKGIINHCRGQYTASVSVLAMWICGRDVWVVSVVITHTNLVAEASMIRQ